jgi:hypothetical protein
MRSNAIFCDASCAFLPVKHSSSMRTQALPSAWQLHLSIDFTSTTLRELVDDFGHFPQQRR